MAALGHFLDTCSLLASSSWPLPWDLAALHVGWDQVMAVLGEAFVLPLSFTSGGSLDVSLGKVGLTVYTPNA